MTDTLPVIVVTDELRALVQTIDFTAMTDDEFLDWLTDHAIAEIPVDYFDNQPMRVGSAKGDQPKRSNP